MRKKPSRPESRPREGLWIVHRERGKTYGRILYIKESGVVVWQGECGHK